MAKVKIERVDDPSETRTVGAESWKRWPKAKDDKGNFIEGVKVGGRHQYREVPKDAVQAPKVKKGDIVAPPEVQKLVKKDPNA